MFSNKYYYNQLNYTSASKHLKRLYYIFEYYLFRLRSQWMVHNFLNITPLFLSSNFFVLPSTPAPYYSIILLLYLSRIIIIFWFFSGDINLSLDISLSSSFVIVSELFCCEGFENFVILSLILLPIKSPVAFAVFWITLLQEVLSASVTDF